ncbi:hydantoinase/oxoprolinase family protein [Agromyces aerolatus]|uniref:hypothetical protein n=1 Tax=Agromyces sp. LY-1074 TaxID=3074080 RepID=UPI002860196A|nr:MULTISPECIES: hypothetical protein [unclassified Agromyces]MDR5701131.1 hypothetical protein [Agromyces sp. LY-1074]MDR5707771.1 hypothetical protein [Agromyces sp. LY-1358]
MRIGVRVTDEAVSGAGRRPGGDFEFAARAVDGDLPGAVEAVLMTLAASCPAPVASVVFDVSRALAREPGAGVVSVLIEPRHPAEPRPHLWRAADLPVTVTNVQGGHGALGNELIPLEEPALHRLAAAIPRGAHVVVSAAGSLVSPDHERRAAEILRAGSRSGSITQSSSFYSESLLVREYTAVQNALLLGSSERLAAQLADAVAQSVGPDARAYVATNEGGCTPLNRLPITPVHSLRSNVAGEMIGAATVAGRTAGRVIVARPGAARIGEFIDGLPSVVTRTVLADGTPLASSFAHVVPLTDLLVSGSADPPYTVLAHGAIDELAPFGLTPAVTTEVDLIAVGAAVVPMSYWHNRVARVTSASEVDGALREGEAIARANLVASGADPLAVRIPESRVVATTYGEAQMVNIRIRGIAATPGSAMPGTSDPAAPGTTDRAAA